MAQRKRICVTGVRSSLAVKWKAGVRLSLRTSPSTMGGEGGLWSRGATAPAPSSVGAKTAATAAAANVRTDFDMVAPPGRDCGDSYLYLGRSVGDIRGFSDSRPVRPPAVDAHT